MAVTHTISPNDAVDCGSTIHATAIRAVIVHKGAIVCGALICAAAPHCAFVARNNAVHKGAVICPPATARGVVGENTFNSLAKAKSAARRQGIVEQKHTVHGASQVYSTARDGVSILKGKAVHQAGVFRRDAAAGVISVHNGQIGPCIALFPCGFRAVEAAVHCGPLPKHHHLRPDCLSVHSAGNPDFHTVSGVIRTRLQVGKCGFPA